MNFIRCFPARTVFDILLVAICMTAVMVPAPAMAAASFFGLGDLSGGTVSSYATGISQNGSAVIGTSNSSAGTQAFYWTQSGGLIGLGYLPNGTQSRALGVSNQGTVVGTDYVSLSPGNGNDVAFRWTTSQGMTNLTPLNALSSAYAVTPDGSVIVGQTGSLAYRWTASTGIVAIGDLPGGLASSFATAVTPDGNIIAGSSWSASGAEAFRWTSNGGMVGLGFLGSYGGFSSVANSISADGSTIVGYSSSATTNLEAFRWMAGTGMTSLGFLPGFTNSTANGVSADGSVIVGQSGGGFNSSAFIWTANKGMLNLRDVLTNNYGLNLTGWTLGTATGISVDGTVIVGTGINPSGNVEAWIAQVPVPVPAALPLFVSGLFGLVFLRRKLH